MYLNIKPNIIFNVDEMKIENGLTNEEIEINDDALEIIECVISEKSYNKILNKIFDIYEESDETKNHIDSFLQYLESNNIIYKCTEYKKSNFRVIKDRRLSRYFIETTAICNLTCKHCYAYNPRELPSIDDLDKLLIHLDQAIEMGVTKVDVTGGEPFLYKHLEKLLFFLTEKNCRINLYTNLTLLDENILEIIKNSSIHSVITSVESLTPIIHDEFRGLKGSWETTINNIKTLIKMKIPVRANIVIHEFNSHEVFDLANYLYNEIGVSSIALDTIFDIGKQQYSHVKSPSQNEVIQIQKSVYKNILNQNSTNIKKSNDLNTSNVNKPCNSCGVGTHMVFVNSKGEYSLCPTLTKDNCNDFFLGNLYSDNFESIVDNLDFYWSNISCKKMNDCQFYDFCKGGCRCRAYLKWNDINEIDDIRCELFEEIAT